MGRKMHCNQVAKADASVVGFCLRTKGLASGPLAPSQCFVRFPLKCGQGVMGRMMHCNQVAKADASVVGFCLHTKGLATGPFSHSQNFVCFFN